MSDPLAMNCPACGEPGRLLSFCKQCDGFLGGTLTLTESEQPAAAASASGLAIETRDLETGVRGGVELSFAQALALAQMFKRLGFIHWRAMSANEEELEEMQEACAAMRQALAEAGWEPR